MRVSPSSRPCSAGDVMRVAGGRGMSERIRGRGLAGAGSRRSRSGVRSAGRARGSEWRTWTCLRRCLRPPGGGRCRLSAGGGPEGATEPFAATVSTNARHTGADSRVPGAAGGAELWHQDLSTLVGELGSRGAPAPAWGQWLLPSGVLFPKGGPCPLGGRCGDRSAAALGRTPSRGWRSPQPSSCALAPRRGDETRTPPPSVSRCCRPSHLPLPFSDSTSGSLPPRSQEKLSQRGL